MKSSLIFCFWLLWTFPTSAQIDLSTQAFGAKSQGLGTVKLYHRDAWSLANNVGAMDRITEFEIGIAADQRFMATRYLEFEVFQIQDTILETSSLVNLTPRDTY